MWTDRLQFGEQARCLVGRTEFPNGFKNRLHVNTMKGCVSAFGEAPLRRRFEGLKAHR